jgi:hypothetical protein
VPLLSEVENPNRHASEYQVSPSEAPAAGFFGLSIGLLILCDIRGIRLGNVLAAVQNPDFRDFPVLIH